MTLADKAEKLRVHFGLTKEMPVAAVVSTAMESLGLHTEGSLIVKADACIAALSSMPVAMAQATPTATVVWTPQPLLRRNLASTTASRYAPETPYYQWKSLGN